MRSTIFVLSLVAVATGGLVERANGCSYELSEDGKTNLLYRSALPNFKEKTLLHHTVKCGGHPDYCHYVANCTVVAFPNGNSSVQIVDGSGCNMEPSIVESIDYEGDNKVTIRARTFLLDGEITNMLSCLPAVAKKVNGVCIRPQCPKLEKSQDGTNKKLKARKMKS